MAKLSLLTYFDQVPHLSRSSALDFYILTVPRMLLVSPCKQCIAQKRLWQSFQMTIYPTPCSPCEHFPAHTLVQPRLNQIQTRDESRNHRCLHRHLTATIRQPRTHGLGSFRHHSGAICLGSTVCEEFESVKGWQETNEHPAESYGYHEDDRRWGFPTEFPRSVARTSVVNVFGALA